MMSAKVAQVKGETMENGRVIFNYKMNDKEINFSFNSDTDIFEYMENFVNFLKAITFNDFVIVNGLIHVLYEFVEKAEVEGNKEIINTIKEMLNELDYLKRNNNE